jgi:hypothetical protein
VNSKEFAGAFLFPHPVGCKTRKENLMVDLTVSATEQVATVATANTQAESLAPSAKTDEHMIPKSRLDEVLAKAEKAEKALLKFQEAEDKRKKDELSEIDRLKLEKREAEDKAEKAATELQIEREKITILAEANKPQFGEKKQKFCNPEIAYKLLTPEDKAKGITEALKELAKENPFLLEQPAQTGDGVGSPKKNNSKSLDEKPLNVKIPHF